MTDKLPPLRWVSQVDQVAGQRKTAAITGVADFLPALHAYKDTDGYEPTESWLQMRDRKKREKKAEQAQLLSEGPLACEFLHEDSLSPSLSLLCLG
jgi:U1 small nuclear ribonucleoprotein 70kDa